MIVEHLSQGAGKSPVPYAKPVVSDLGSLRDLTRIGCGPDADGGFLGIADGNLSTCFRSS